GGNHTNRTAKTLSLAASVEIPLKVTTTDRPSRAHRLSVAGTAVGYHTKKTENRNWFALEATGRFFWFSLPCVAAAAALLSPSWRQPLSLPLPFTLALTPGLHRS